MKPQTLIEGRPAMDATVIEATDIIALVTASPVVAFTDPAKFEAYYERVKAETAKAGTDVSTKAARDTIRSAAFDIVKSRTALDKAGLRLSEDARETVKQINAARKVIETRLDELAAEVRKPLTDWEEAEKAREATAKAFFDRLKAAETVTFDDTAAGVSARLAEIEALQIDAEAFGDYADAAREVWSKTTTDLGLAVERLTQVEADRAELQRMRDAETTRLAQVEADRLEAARLADVAEVAAMAARDAEAARLAEEQRVALAAEQAKAEAATEAASALAAAEQRAADERKALEDAHAAELERIEADAQAERDRLAEVERQRLADAAEAERQEKARQEDREHRAKIMGEAKVALIADVGLTEPQAIAVVRLIVAGSVPNVSIQF